MQPLEILSGVDGCMDAGNRSHRRLQTFNVTHRPLLCSFWAATSHVSTYMCIHILYIHALIRWDKHPGVVSAYVILHTLPHTSCRYINLSLPSHEEGRASLVIVLYSLMALNCNLRGSTLNRQSSGQHGEADR